MTFLQITQFVCPPIKDAQDIVPQTSKHEQSYWEGLMVAKMSVDSWVVTPFELTE